VTKRVIFLLHTFLSCVLKIEKRNLLIIVLAFAHCGAALSQMPKMPAPIPVPAKKPAPEPPSPPPSPQAIPISDIAVQAEIALARVRQLENKSRIDDLIQTAAEELPVLARDTTLRIRETRHLLGRNTDLETIKGLEETWREIESRASSLTRDLTRAALQLDRDLQELQKLGAIWDVTAKAAMGAAAPPEVLDRVREVRESIAAAQSRVLDDRARVLALQSKAAEIGARAAQARQALADASERAVTRLLFRDSPPLWSATFWRTSFKQISKEAEANLSGHGDALAEYLRAHEQNIVFHVLFFLGLVAAFSSIQSKISVLCETDAELQRARKVYDMPVTSAMLVALLASTWFYPRPPRAFWIMISVLGAAPVVAFARRVIDSGLYPVLYAIVGFYLVDRLRAILAPLPGISRLLFLAEAIPIMLFIFWALRESTYQAHAPPWSLVSAWLVIRFAAWFALFLISIAVLANIAGYVRMADLIIRKVLGSAYTAVLLYALTRVGEGMILGLLYIPPFSMLRMVRRHRMPLTHRIDRALKWAAFLAWVGLTLHSAGLLQPVIRFVKVAWRASINIGSLNLSLGDVISAVVIIWAAFAGSRLLRFTLEEEVYPNVRLNRGLPYAVSTMLHYVLLVSGFVVALGVIGVDMTKFTIVVGALTVGIGFGLQNIVNNFISGLIVLFERPIKVGDTIQIDDVIGRVQHIGIRASIVASTTGAEVIIPNGKLISDKLTNWTLSNQLRQVIVPVVTKPDINVTEFKKLLLEIAQKNKLVVPNPPPEVLFIKRGIDNFEFELRVWTDNLDAWLEVKSDLMTDINEALRENEMSVHGQPPASEPFAPPSPAAPPTPSPAAAPAAATPGQR
jgi:potassium efflux system protein